MATAAAAAAVCLSNLLSSLNLNSQTPPPKPSIINVCYNNRRVEMPSAVANIMYFKSAYNVQVIVHENETDDMLIKRFRREVFKARVIQDCKRRRFFENPRDKAKRKLRDASKRKRKFRREDKPEEANEKNKKDKEDDSDNWNEDPSAHDFMIQISQTSNRWDNDERRSSSNTRSDNTTLPFHDSQSKKKGKWNK